MGTIIKDLAKQCNMSVYQFKKRYDIPLNGHCKNKLPYTFSGKRVCRGLYISKKGIKLNADVNGASNIIKKAIDTAFNNIRDFSYLYSKIERISIY
jgi:hypothetical protein